MKLKELINFILFEETNPELVADKIYKAYKNYNGYSTGIDGMCKILYREYKQHNGFIDNDINRTTLTPNEFKNRFDNRIKKLVGENTKLGDELYEILYGNLNGKNNTLLWLKKLTK